MFPQIGHGPDLGQKMEWIRDTRICHELFFESYFRLAIPAQQLTQKEISDIFEAMEKRESLKTKLSELYKKVGLRELLVRIQCHHSRLKPESVSNLLCELWALDEEDARAAGVERKWDTRDATQAMTRFLLKNYCQAGTQRQLALQAMNDSGTIYPLARFVSSEQEELKKDPHSSNTAFIASELEDLRKEVIKGVRESAANGKLLDSPDGGVLLFIWARLEPSQTIRDWLKTQLPDSKRLPFILSRFVFKSTSTDHRGTKAHYSVSRKTLEQFLDLDQLDQQLKVINSATLPHWEKFAVEQTLKRLDERQRGIQEAEYPE